MSKTSNSALLFWWLFYIFFCWGSFFVLLFATPLSYHIKCEFKIYTKHLHALGLIKHYAPVTLHTSWATKTIEAQQFNPTLPRPTPSWSHANWHAVVWQWQRMVVAWLSLEFNLLAARENILFGRPMCRQRGFYGYSLAWMPRPHPRCHRWCSICCCVVVVVAAFDLDNSALFEFSCSLSLSPLHFPLPFFCFWKYFAVTICIFLIFAPQWNRMRWKCAAKVTLEFHVLLQNPLNFL